MSTNESPVEVYRARDLIFPNGNERGEYSEPLYVARAEGRAAHGRNPAEAEANLRVLLGHPT